MKTLFFDGGALELKERPLPIAAEGEALIKVLEIYERAEESSKGS